MHYFFKLMIEFLYYGAFLYFMALGFRYAGSRIMGRDKQTLIKEINKHGLFYPTISRGK